MRASVHQTGVVLIAVLLLSAVAWSLLAAALSQAWIHSRLVQGAVRGAVVTAAADAELARLLADMATGDPGFEAWQPPVDLPSVGACFFAVEDVQIGDGWGLLQVSARFEGAAAYREGTVRAP